MALCLAISRRVARRGESVPVVRAKVRRKARIAMAPDVMTTSPSVPFVRPALFVTCPPIDLEFPEVPTRLAIARYAENLPARYEFDEFFPVRPVDLLV